MQNIEYTANGSENNDKDNDIQPRQHKLRSWIWYWGVACTSTNKKIFFFDCEQYFNEGEKCEAKIELSGSAGNAISHLA